MAMGKIEGILASEVKARTRLLTIALFLFTSCASTKLDEQFNCCENTFFTELKEEELTLDIKKYMPEMRDTTLLENEEYEFRLSSFQSGNVMKYMTYKKPGIKKWLKYDPEGNLMFVTFYYAKGTTKICKEYHFNPDHTVAKVINHEKGYAVCWEEALALVKKYAKRDVRRFGITEFYMGRPDLEKSPDTDACWVVHLFTSESAMHSKVIYRIDGITGKLLGRYPQKPIWVEDE